MEATSQAWPHQLRRMIEAEAQACKALRAAFDDPTTVGTARHTARFAEWAKVVAEQAESVGVDTSTAIRIIHQQAIEHGHIPIESVLNRSDLRLDEMVPDVADALGVELRPEAPITARHVGDTDADHGDPTLPSRTFGDGSYEAAGVFCGPDQ